MGVLGEVTHPAMVRLALESSFLSDQPAWSHCTPYSPNWVKTST
jgi:hypothetical protein